MRPQQLKRKKSVAGQQELGQDSTLQHRPAMSNKISQPHATGAATPQIKRQTAANRTTFSFSPEGKKKREARSPPHEPAKKMRPGFRKHRTGLRGYHTREWHKLGTDSSASAQPSNRRRSKSMRVICTCYDWSRPGRDYSSAGITGSPDAAGEHKNKVTTKSIKRMKPTSLHCTRGRRRVPRANTRTRLTTQNIDD